MCVCVCVCVFARNDISEYVSDIEYISYQDLTYYHIVLFFDKLERMGLKVKCLSKNICIYFDNILLLKLMI